MVSITKLISDPIAGFYRYRVTPGLQRCRGLGSNSRRTRQLLLNFIVVTVNVESLDQNDKNFMCLAGNNGAL